MHTNDDACFDFKYAVLESATQHILNAGTLKPCRTLAIPTLIILSQAAIAQSSTPSDADSFSELMWRLATHTACCTRWLAPLCHFDCRRADHARDAADKLYVAGTGPTLRVSRFSRCMPRRVCTYV